MEQIIPIKLLSDLATIPKRGPEYAAGYDLYAATSYAIDIAPHSTIKIGTGIAVELKPDTFGAIFARSGLATKKGLRPANCVGVCRITFCATAGYNCLNLSRCLSCLCCVSAHP